MIFSPPALAAYRTASQPIMRVIISLFIYCHYYSAHFAVQHGPISQHFTSQPPDWAIWLLMTVWLFLPDFIDDNADISTIYAI
jgi:hypothetical protein